jgi:hypothetical protein
MRAGLRNHRFTQIHTDSGRRGRRDGAASRITEPQMDTDSHRYRAARTPGRRCAPGAASQPPARPSAPVREPAGSRPVASVLAPGVRKAIFFFGGDRYRSGTDGYGCISGICIHLVYICIHHFYLVRVALGAAGPASEDAGTGREAAASRTVHAAERSGAKAPQPPSGRRATARTGTSSVWICVYLWLRQSVG